ncbi:HTH-type transcriptional activator CmpR [Rubripirellula amarantea]|uniref:HTH-type transcriptional activator CmpR n=1 Tax=Rubripirellula amarantea TaxID=2527999 RepID=A0A5C5WDX3_9BACT|nr:LysR family transcriptional regulator [Rubripirellula amarantea]TWT49166.1 HTH-type transcriptional activator CmpR [Rubripirellula amarantea]
MKPRLLDNAASLTVQQIRTFCAVFELGGYADAARELNQTGTTLWEQIKVLQRIYGTELFQRKGRRIEPTTAGKLLHQQLGPILEAIESSFQLVAEQTQAEPTEVRMVTGVRMMLEELGSPLGKFAKQFPNSQLKLMTADNATAQRMVADAVVDVALLIEPPRDALLDGLSIERLYPIEYLAVFPRSHPLAKRSTIRVADLLHEPLIIGNVNTVGRRLLEQAIFRLGLETQLQPAVETDNSAVTMACVRAGMGVGLIAGRHDGNLTKPLTTRTLSKELGQVHMVSITRAGWAPTQAMRRLLESVKEELAGPL